MRTVVRWERWEPRYDPDAGEERDMLQIRLTPPPRGCGWTRETVRVLPGPLVRLASEPW